MNDKIKQAIEVHLTALDQTFQTAWENVDFKPTNAPFQAPTFLFAEPDDQGFRDSPYIQRGIFTNTLAYPTNEGGESAQNKADEVANHFKRGTSLLTTAGFSVIFDRTPEITGGAIEGDRFIIRVRCRFFAHISPGE